MFYKNPQSKINRSFFFFAFSIAAWDVISYNFGIAQNYEAAFAWSLLFPIVIPLIMPALHYFITSYTEEEVRRNKWYEMIVVNFGTVVTIVMGLISGYMYPNIVNIVSRWQIYQGKSDFSVLTDNILSLIGLIILITTFVTARKFYKRTYDPLKKIQLKNMAWGMVISLSIDSMESIKWYVPEFQPPVIAIASLTLMVMIIAYGIVRYDLFAINASTAAETIFSTMTDGVFLLDAQYRVALVNQSAMKMLNEVREKIIGRPLSTFFSSEGKVQLQEHIDAKLKKESHFFDVEGIVTTEHVEGRYISIAGSHIKSSRGEVRGTVCIVRDITDRKIQEKRLKDSYESIKLADRQIRLELAKLQAILGSVGEGLIVLDDRDGIAMMNTRAEEILSWSADDKLGKPFYANFAISNDKGDVFPFEEKAKEHLSKQDLAKFSLTDSLYVRVSDTKRIPLSITATPVALDKDTAGTILIFEDITKEMEIDKAKTEFVSLAAHQLRAPITAIKWNLEVLESDDQNNLSEESKEFLKGSSQAATAMSDLVSQFLNVSRIDLGNLSVNPEPLKITDVVEEVLAEQKMTAIEKKQSLVTKLAKTIKQIPLDKVLIRIVIQNLISNALKYTPAEGKITITLEKKPKFALFTVKDTGIGIPKEQHAKLFEKLFRADNAVQSGLEGNGLGLYIVKSVVKLAKGDIWFESEVGKGTTFFVTIPYGGMEAKKGTRGLVEVQQ